MRTRLARLGRALVGDTPAELFVCLTPTLFALALDVALRGGALAAYAPQGKLIYASSVLISAALWALPLSLATRLLGVPPSPTRTRARGLAAALFGLWVLPAATLSLGGQALYHRVFHAYMGRDTLRLGIALRGTVQDWFTAWSSPLLVSGMLLVGLIVTVAALVVASRAARSVAGRFPLLPGLLFVGALACCWTDNVDSRFLQAALPDACFFHGLVHVARVALTGQGRTRQGVSIRTPAPLPPLASSGGRAPNVVLVLTESVRADTLCSEPPPRCRARFLDEVASDRVALGKLTSQTPNTFSACMVLWTGLPPNAPFRDAHSAPVLWELARAVGHRTLYVSSQNPNYEDFGVFVQRAGIDVTVTATELGGMTQEQLGAPDERATSELVRLLRETPGDARTLAVLHLSNTHAPYRVDPDLQPFSPHSDAPLGDVAPFANHYRNSVLLQERTLAGFLRELRGLPSWDDTVVVVLSDHGEQLREHGGLYHNHTLYDEELRVPGFVLAGARALGEQQRSALRALSGRRTYAEDVNATIVDLLGLDGARASLPFSERRGGRSLLRPLAAEPVALLATSTAVWEPDDARFGAMTDERLVFGAPGGAWRCFDLRRDPGQRAPLARDACGALPDLVRAAFPVSGLSP